MFGMIFKKTKKRYLNPNPGAQASHKFHESNEILVFSANQDHFDPTNMRSKSLNCPTRGQWAN